MREVLSLVVLGGLLAGGVAAQAPALTREQRLQVEVLNLVDELRKAIADAANCHAASARDRRTALDRHYTETLDRLQADVAATFPGFLWDPTTGVFTPQLEAGR